MQSNLLEYVWIDGYDNVRSKIKVTNVLIKSIEDIPIWNYDGSSTNQASTNASEITLIPVTYYKCPFKKNDHSFIVLCETYYSDMTPTTTNHRNDASIIFNKYKNHEAWYGLEQEYFVFDNKTNLPLNYTEGPHTKYYCSVGENSFKLRNLMNVHLNHCLYMGIKMSGCNMEVVPGQAEFQIGPECGLKACDDLWIARFVLQKLSEMFKVTINYHPKPIPDCNGSGCHTNFSCINTRKENGYSYILECMDKLKNKHKEHLEVYGIDNHLRLTGVHETASIDTFSYSVGGRNTSIRIGLDTFSDKRGYFEDRRPASNMDPYLVCPLILKTCVE